jgi:phosphatidylcholine synthase
MSSLGAMPSASRWRRQCLGWCVHFYTALGLIAAAVIAVLLMHGGVEAYRRIFLLMIAATLIDATDGTLARWVRVKEVLPGFDGRRLDDLVDFLTYTCLPLLLLWRAAILPPNCQAVLLLPLLASAYGFCQTSVKTDDGYFLGFPSYWNLVVFYLYVLQPLPAAFTLGSLVVLSLLTFVPSRYLYPSQRGRLNRAASLLGAFWALLLVFIVWNMPDDSTRSLAVLSLFYPAWYFAASWIISVRYWRKSFKFFGERGASAP